MSSVIISGDTSGAITVSAPAVSGTTTLTLPATTGTVIASDASANIQFNSGYGSVATAYGCRAWVNFNGTGTVAIRASGNVSSITDNGTGDYTVNFTTTLVDANYTSVVSCSPSYASQVSMVNINAEQAGLTEVAPTTGAFRMVIRDRVGSTLDAKYVNVSVFR